MSTFFQLGDETTIANIQEPRISFWMLVNMLDSGITEEQLQQKYSWLSSAEIKAAVKYARSTAVKMN